MRHSLRRNRQSKRLAAIGLAATAFASVGLGSAQVASATTAPGAHTYLPVLITGKGFAVGNDARLPRGVLVTFVVRNKSSKKQNFVIFGKKTDVLKPGAQGSITILLMHRGIFTYRSTLDNDRPFRGVFIVY